MLYGFSTSDSVFNANMRRWRKQATVRYLLAVIFIVGAPILANTMAHYVSPEALNTRYVTATIGSWRMSYFLSFVIVFLFIELASHAMVKMSRETKKKDYRVGMLLRPLVEQAGLEWPVRILELREDKRLNAGALRSFAYGRKVILMGDIGKLTKEELRAVLAHEVAHLAMRDVRTGHVLLALRLAVRVVNFLVLLALLASLVRMNMELTWFLLVTYVITGLGAGIAKQFALAYSRVCEYRADAIGVQLTSDAHRKLLISAINKVREISLLVVLRQKEKDELDFGKTHPSIKNRAKALGLVLKEIGGRFVSART